MAIKNTNVARPAANKAPQKEMEIGNYFCRIAQVIDLGLHHKDVWDAATNSFVKDMEKAPVQMIMVTYEFVTEFMKDEQGNDLEDKPRWLSETFPLHSLKVDLATSTKRYNAIDPKGEFGGDWSLLLGAPCTVTIAHKKSGKAKIGNVAPPMKGMPVPDLKNEPKMLDLSEPDLEIFRSLPEWLQERVKENLEYNGSPLQKLLAGGVVGGVVEAPAAPEPEPEVEEGEGDDNPW